MAEKTKNLRAQIPESLHSKVRERQETSGKTLSEYMTWLITSFYEQEGMKNMDGKQKTIAFQVPPEMFEQFKQYLKRHDLKQVEFFLNCIQQALDADQQEAN